MRLTRIKLAGFKSFVDPTTIELKDDLVCIVGPNGCGKSNTIDAVRWVMGESSAKHLRGDSMTDVIFNGSTGRKPVGQAFVELVFDNTDGTLGGEYSAYSEICIKRLVTRDGQSSYFLNGVRCRRRDITHIFMGTGLGARSYSIIEQGTISRLIEAKPEDLRNFLEETAGISKYKDRRRETETRIRHTRENLDRLNDLRDELVKQQEKLQRQAKAAEQYKLYKTEEEALQAQLHAIHWRDLDRKAQREQANLAGQEAVGQGLKAELTRLDTVIEQARISHHDHNDALQAAQNHFYTVGSEAARLEQDLKHARERIAQLTEEHTRILQERSELEAELAADAAHAVALTERLATLQPEAELARTVQQESTLSLHQREQALDAWQKSWDSFNHGAHQISQQAHGEQTTLTHLEQSTVKANERVSKLAQQLAEIQTETLQHQLQQSMALVAQRHEQLELNRVALDQVKLQITEQRAHNQNLQEQLDQAKDHHQALKSEHLSLQALQEAALGQKDESAMQWLAQHDLSHYPRLAQSMTVEAGYERAVETVLGDYLQAVCVPDLDPLAGILSSLEGKVQFLEKNTAPSDFLSNSLLSKVSCDQMDLSPWLGKVLVADTLSQALQWRTSLEADQSIITQDGFWLSRGWLRVNHQAMKQESVIAREHRLHTLAESVVAQQAVIDKLTHQLQAGRDQLEDKELSRDDAQRRLNEAHRLLSEAKAQLQGIEKESQQAAARTAQLQQELNELRNQMQADNEKIKSTRELLAQHLDLMAQHEAQKQAQLGEKQTLQTALQEARLKAKEDNQRANELNMEVHQAKTQLEAAQKNQHRMGQQQQGLLTREADLVAQLRTTEDPIADLDARLAEQLNLRATADTALQTARATLDGIAHALRQTEQERSQADLQYQAAREALSNLQLALQEITVRRATIEEQMQEAGLAVTAILESLAEDADARAWESNLESVRERIRRLGAINLAAIEEYDATHERAAYMEAQHKDLSDALDALEGAIAKIDRESRDRFKETFETVNNNLKELFPRVFGGGEAYLEMTSDDLLETGITIMARPPGKRNATIHLLSGGEKALTAMALVFSLFRLNPSPFCMLDEVDAPLDDSNVGRFCNLVKEMAKSVQFIYITHNKLTMEMADTMMGVTMKEPGVSRIVTVNIDEATELAQA
jgi:chromosome segregation protein